MNLLANPTAGPSLYIFNYGTAALLILTYLLPYLQACCQSIKITFKHIDLPCHMRIIHLPCLIRPDRDKILSSWTIHKVILIWFVDRDWYTPTLLQVHTSIMVPISLVNVCFRCCFSLGHQLGCSIRWHYHRHCHSRCYHCHQDRYCRPLLPASSSVSAL